MFINTAGGNVRLNGVSSVTTPDIVATNGVIHVVDAVIGDEDVDASGDSVNMCFSSNV